MTHPFASEHYQNMANEARKLVRQWVTEAQNEKSTFAAEQLAGVLKDPNGLPFTAGFVVTSPILHLLFLPSCRGI